MSLSGEPTNLPFPLAKVCDSDTERECESDEGGAKRREAGDESREVDGVGGGCLGKFGDLLRFRRIFSGSSCRGTIVPERVRVERLSEILGDEACFGEQLKYTPCGGHQNERRAAGQPQTTTQGRGDKRKGRANTWG